LLSVEGDSSSNPGTIQNVFDLSGRQIGGNGFLLLLQKGSPFSLVAGATVLIHTGSGTGWGSGPTSTVGHTGEEGRTDLENGSQTFFLIRTTNPPIVGTDADTDNDGVMDGAVLATWTVLDSVGLLDDDGLGDMTYGAITFRFNLAARASGHVVETFTFTPGYLGRTNNTTGSLPAAWLASANLTGVEPNWLLGNLNDTVPSNLAFAPLNHVGGPNFGGAKLAGVMVTETGHSTDVSESGATDSYSLALNTAPAGNVVVRLTAGEQLQVSADNGVTYGNARNVTFSSTTPRVILVKATDDTTVDSSPHVRHITHAITSTADAAQYPTNSLLPVVNVNIADNDPVLFNELKVNPPGTNDGPYEFIELKGRPDALLTNVYVVAVVGDDEKGPGKAAFVAGLNGVRLGANGLLVIAAAGHPYNIPPTTPVVFAPQLDEPGGALGNGTMTFLLLSSAVPMVEGEDLDRGNDGLLEGLAPGTTLLDSVGWSDGGASDLVYSGALLTQSAGTPDAASRLPGHTTAHSAEAWFNGDLAGSDPASLAFDPKNVSADFPVGTELTPGVLNDTAPTVSPLPALSGVLGDPTNPRVLFSVDDAESGAEGLTVWVTSSNAEVVPEARLLLEPGPTGTYLLTIEPVGVGYTTITVNVHDGTTTRRVPFAYAASAMGRPGGRFLTGSSDASAAIAVDANWMFVGDDEDQGIRLYPRYQSGAAANRFDFGAFLNLVDVGQGVPKEADLEGVTRVGSRLYWIGSHSHGAQALTKTNRARIFATDLSGTGPTATLTFVGRYEWLKNDLVNWDVANGHGKGANYYGLLASTAEGVDAKAPDGSGFNIEGLTMAPGSSTTAYIGFRAPLVSTNTRARALIVPVLNFTALAIGNGPPGSAQFGAPIELNLGYRGIRSMECDAEGCLLVAGPPDKATDVTPRDFKFFTWTGQPGDRPQQRGGDLRTWVPESIVALPPRPWTADTLVQVLSDNGVTVWYGDGIEAKRLDEPAFKKFRSDWVALGAVVVPQPAILSQRMTNGVLTLTWCAEEGRTYRVEWSSNLESSPWTPLPGDVLATDAFASKTDTVQLGGQRFYRVAVLP
jgi:hypothetical protein